jgi:hypothetical protein
VSGHALPAESDAFVELADFDEASAPPPKSTAPATPKNTARKGATPAVPKGSAPAASKGGPPKGGASIPAPRGKNPLCRKRGSKGGRIQRRGVATSYDITRECENLYLLGSNFKADYYKIDAKGDKSLIPGTTIVDSASTSLNIKDCVSSQYQKLIIKHLS